VSSGRCIFQAYPQLLPGRQQTKDQEEISTRSEGNWGGERGVVFIVRCILPRPPFGTSKKGNQALDATSQPASHSTSETNPLLLQTFYSSSIGSVRTRSAGRNTHKRRDREAVWYGRYFPPPPRRCCRRRETLRNARAPNLAKSMLAVTGFPRLAARGRMVLTHVA
jgi:hypothetical protein